MDRTKRQSLLLLYLLPAAVTLCTPFLVAQTPDARAAEAELRARIAELEAQNAAILKQLSAIQAQLSRESAGSTAAKGVEVASTTPIVPPSRVASPIPQAPAPQPAPSLVQTEGNRSELSFYGFVRADAIFDDSRANAFQTPLLIRPEPAGSEDRSNFTFHPRLTRIGMNYRAPGTLDGLAGARLTGKIEMDFQNGGRESRAIPRYRHAYLQLSWGPHALLAGQTWDLISPLFPTVNADTLMWNAGNLGDRRMQLRYSFDPNPGLSFRAAVGLTGAVDAQDADSNGILDGEASTLPNFQGRIGYNSSTILVGAWAHYAQLQTDATFGGKNEFDAYSYGGDFELRFTPQVNLRGELWAGSGLGDVRGGIGQSFSTATGKEIDSRGGWLELGLRPPGPYSFSAGYTMDDPKNGHVAASGPTENRAWYVTNQFRLAPPLTLGVDYLYWWTHFKGLDKGTDNRINLYFVYGF